MEQGTLSLYEILGERSTTLCQSAEKDVVENEEVKVSGKFINHSECQTVPYFIRPLVERAYQKYNFLISQLKHMLWVLKRTVSMRRFF